MKEQFYEYKPAVEPPVRTVDGVSGAALLRVETMASDLKKMMLKLKRDKKDRDTVITIEPSVASHLDGPARILFLKQLGEADLSVARVKATPAEKVALDMPTRKGDVYFTYIGSSERLVKAAKAKKRKEQNAASKSGSEAPSEDEDEDDENEDGGATGIHAIEESIKENEDALKTGNDEICLSFPPHGDFKLHPLNLVDLHTFCEDLGLCIKFLEATTAEKLKEGNKTAGSAYHIFVAKTAAAVNISNDNIIASRSKLKRKRALQDATNVEGGKMQSK